jgi:hypothetical protein
MTISAARQVWAATAKACGAGGARDCRAPVCYTDRCSHRFPLLGRVFPALFLVRERQFQLHKIGVMQVWQKQDGGWKLLARASYRLPQQAKRRLGSRAKPVRPRSGATRRLPERQMRLAFCGRLLIMAVRRASRG